MRKNNLVAPVVKWVEGKRQLLDETGQKNKSTPADKEEECDD